MRQNSDLRRRTANRHYPDNRGFSEALRQKVVKFIHCSSSEVYGSAITVPMKESHPTHPCTVYGSSKLAGEAHARAYHSTYGLPAIIVRPFNMAPESLGQLLEEEWLEAEIRALFTVEKIIRCYSLYYIGTRVLQSLVYRDLQDNYDTEFNRFFGRLGRETPAGGDFSPNKIYVLRKR